METEIKTLVYRDRADKNDAVQARKQTGMISRTDRCVAQKRQTGSEPEDCNVIKSTAKNVSDTDISAIAEMNAVPEVKIIQYHEKITAQKRRVLNRRLAGIAAALLVVLVVGITAVAMGIKGNAVVSAADDEKVTMNQAVVADYANEMSGSMQLANAELTRDAEKDVGAISDDSGNLNAEIQNNETEQASTSKTDSANAASVISSVASNVGFEESIVLMLLSDMANEQEEDNYIPATLGRHDVSDAGLNSDGPEGNTASDSDASLFDGETENEFAENAGDLLDFENSITAESGSRLEAVETVAEILIGPDDVPEGLIYEYNPDMQLQLTAHEIEVLQRIVEAEATGMGVYGKMLVANVVINRVNSRYFANDVEAVVFQRIGGSYQFSPIKDGRYYSVKITDTTREAVERVLSGEDYSEGALYFFQRSATSKTKATWFDKNLKFLFKFGAHEFFTEYKK